MAEIRRCGNKNCIYNSNGKCQSDDVEMDIEGQCMTIEEKEN